MKRKMMVVISSLFAAALLFLFIAAPLPAPPGIGGNPGDIRILMFKKARIEATNAVYKISIFRNLVERELNLTGPVEKIFFDDGILEKLSVDILQSPHQYDVKERPTCAWTNDPDPAVKPPGLDTVRLSLPTCAPYLKNRGQTYAVHILIHESVHHLLRDDAFRKSIGLEFTGDDSTKRRQEEDFCDLVAETAIAAFEKIAKAGVPHWTDMSMQHNLEQRGFHSAFWTGETGNPLSANRMLIWGGCRETETAIYGCAKYFNDGGLYNPYQQDKAKQWENIVTINAPEGRIEHAAVWTDFAVDKRNRFKMFVWGGCTSGDGCIKYLNTGGIFDPAARNWVPVGIDENTPSARSNHSVVWTGSEYLVWGGSFGAHTPNQKAVAYRDGASYNPLTQHWTKIAENPDLKFAGRSFHSAIWTGNTGNPVSSNKMLVWGGCDVEEYLFCNNHYNDGAFYDPKTGTWSALEAKGVAPSARRLHGELHIRERNLFMVWGGQQKNRELPDGAYLDLKTMTWNTMKQPAPERRSRHTLVWTGEHVIAFGGETSNDGYVEDIGVYTLPATGSGPGQWEALRGEFLPFKVKNHTAIWTPVGMMVWGGQTDYTAFENIGAIFHPGNIGE